MNLQFSLDNGKLIIVSNGKKVDTSTSLLSFVHWYERLTPINEEALKDIQEASGIIVPDFYLQFVQLTSGDSPEINNHPGSDLYCRANTLRGGRFECIPMWEGISDFQQYSSNFIYEFAYFYGGEGVKIDCQALKLLPIYNANGNSVCLDFSKDKTKPKIIFADIEEGNIYPVADNFLDFLLNIEIS